MKIKINHISRIEGHIGFVANILKGDVESAKIEIHSSARLIEGLLIGRYFEDAPIITSRICGICPVVHNLCACKALENAFRIKIDNDTKNLRKLMMYGQVIHSHGLHAFFLSLADFFDLANDIDLVKKYPKETQLAIKIRDFGVNMDKVLGGRTVHPIRSDIGGFKKLPTKKELKQLLEQALKVLPMCIELTEFFQKLKYPKFERETEHMCIHHSQEYGIYTGNIVSTLGLNVNIKKFTKDIKEIQKPYYSVKQARWDDKTFMVGALSRINNNYSQLNKQAKKLWLSVGLEIPCYNSFYNIYAQVVEIVHCVEESIKILEKLNKRKLSAKKTKYNKKSCKGGAAIEAPRGTLYHEYELDSNGYIINCNIITPTAQFIGNLEHDIMEYIPNLNKLSMVEKKKKIRMLIRAYDPCITCATH